MDVPIGKHLHKQSRGLHGPFPFPSFPQSQSELEPGSVGPHRQHRWLLDHVMDVVFQLIPQTAR